MHFPTYWYLLLYLYIHRYATATPQYVTLPPSGKRMNGPQDRANAFSFLHLVRKLCSEHQQLHCRSPLLAWSAVDIPAMLKTNVTTCCLMSSFWTRTSTGSGLWNIIQADHLIGKHETSLRPSLMLGTRLQWCCNEPAWESAFVRRRIWVVRFLPHSLG